jgi:hypothetical protein
MPASCGKKRPYSQEQTEIIPKIIMAILLLGLTFRRILPSNPALSGGF